MSRVTNLLYGVWNSLRKFINVILSFENYIVYGDLLLPKLGNAKTPFLGNIGQNWGDDLC